MMKAHNPEQHICDPKAGHEHSINCWCEPSRVYWMKDYLDHEILVVEHNDEAKTPHVEVIKARTHTPDWITMVLWEVGKD